MRLRTLLPLLVLSGAASLVLEVAWFRRMAQVGGGTALAMAAVLAAVIGGMAAGSFCLGRVADRVRSPLRLYGLLELGVAAAAILTPSVITASEGLFIGLHRHLAGLPVVLGAARFLLAAVLLAPPAILMGGTLPAAAAALRVRPEDRGRAIGALYAANTLGAVGGTILAGFALIPVLGLAWATRSAGVLSALAGASAVLMAYRGRPGGEPAAGPVAPAVPVAEARRALLLYSVSGFLGLVAEVAFARSLVLVFGSTTQAFSTMLALFLLGIGAGSVLGARLARRPGCHLRRLATTLAATAALFSLAALVVYALPRLYLEIYRVSEPGFEVGLLISFLLSAIVLLPGAVGLGVAFPLAVHLAAGARTVGDGAGRLYAANTAASIVGSTLAVFLLVPLLGPQHAVAATAVAAALVAYLASRRLATGLLLLVALVGLVPPPGAARERWLAGVYFSPTAFVVDGEIDERSWELGVDIPFVRHGTNATVAIWRWAGHSSLLIDGKAVASNQVLSDDHHLSLLGHLPMLVHRDPQDVLVVGLGMGTTFRAVAAHSPRSIRVVEIEPAVIEAASRLGIRPANVILADARTYLRATDERFDVITSDPIHPWVRGSADLYTTEYFQACRDQLRPGGVACHWFPTHQMGLEDVRAVARTFASVFRAAAYYGGGDLVLVGVAEGEVPLPRPFETGVDPVLESDLGRLRVADHETLVAAAGKGPLLTEDALRLEFSTPRHMDSPEMAACIGWVQAMWAHPPAPYDDLLEAERLGALDDGPGRWARLDRALERAPHHVYACRYVGEMILLSADRAVRSGLLDDGEYFLGFAERLLGEDPRVEEVRADLLERRGLDARAIAIVRRRLEETPDSRPLRRWLSRLGGR